MSRDDDSGRLSRRRLLQGTVLTGGVLGAAGLYRVASDSATAQNNDESVTAEFCGSFSPGPQVQQCIDCVEEQCPGEDVNALTPIFTGLTGECFSPDTIPTGAEYVSLKGATNCYVAPVDGATTFCMPDGAPDISNATFYRCGGEPTPEIVDVSVTCSAITVTTANIPNGTTVTATTTFVDAESNESTTVFQATVQENSATFSLPGDKNPIFVTLSLNGTDLDSQSIVASDFPCTEKPPDPPTPDDPRIDDITVTCKSITITTVDIPAGADTRGNARGGWWGPRNTVCHRTV
ncbi:MAG: hypothetical protein U5K37_00610 [Natrialbaceae archaeon]|nr:hypothetical protein [Natrialbaceae archaeon]